MAGTSTALAWALAGSKLSSKSSACAAVPLTSAAQGAARRISAPITVQGPSPQDRTVRNTLRVTVSAAPGMVTPMVSMNAFRAATIASCGHFPDAAASHAPYASSGLDGSPALISLRRHGLHRLARGLQQRGLDGPEPFLPGHLSAEQVRHIERVDHAFAVLGDVRGVHHQATFEQRAGELVEQGGPVTCGHLDDREAA